MTVETFSRKPFISYDKIDDNGVRAEVKVTLGFGYIKEIKPSEKGVSNNVIFVVGNTKFTLNGWVPKTDPIFETVEKSFQAKEPIYFRLEQRRKNDVDRSKTMDEIAPPRDMQAARENTFKALAAVKTQNEEKWELSPHIATRFEEDPKDNASEDAYSVSLEEFTGKKNTTHTQSKTQAKYGFEPAPFITKNNDGSLNIGSVAVSVPISLYGFVSENTKNINITEKQKIVLAKALLNIANKLQLSIYEGKIDKPDLSVGSHSRARQIIFEGIKSFSPITEDIFKDKEKFVQWEKTLFEKSLNMWKWSISEIEKIL